MACAGNSSQKPQSDVMSAIIQQESANSENPNAITMRWSTNVVSRAASGAPKTMNTPR